MINWFDNEVKTLHILVKVNNRALIAQIGILILSIAAVYFNFKWGTNVGAGIFISNTIYTSAVIFHYWVERRYSKKMLSYYKKIEGQDLLKKSIEEYENAKNAYERITKREVIIE